MADGAVRAEGEAVRESLVSGREVANLLPASVHANLSSEADLAREVLEFHDDDRRRFLAFVASTSDTRELAETALRIDEALPRWVNEAENDHDRDVRRRNAKGVRLEVFSYGLRVAKAGGSRDTELRAIDRYGGQILELPPDDRIAVFNATSRRN